MNLKKIFINLFLMCFLNGCAQNVAFLAPAYTLVNTGNIYQAGASYGSNKAIKIIREKNLFWDSHNVFFFHFLGCKFQKWFWRDWFLKTKMEQKVSLSLIFFNFFMSTQDTLKLSQQFCLEKSWKLFFQFVQTCSKIYKYHLYDLKKLIKTIFSHFWAILEHN